MLIYEKKVLSDPSDPSSTKVVRLFGTTNTIPSDSDQPLLYKNASNTEIDASVVACFTYAYNYNGGMKASTSTAQIPDASDTVVNVFLSDETPIIVTKDTDIKYTVSLSASHGTWSPTSGSISSTGSATFTLTAATGYVLPTNVAITGNASTTWDVSTGKVTVSEPSSMVTISAICATE